MSKRLQRPCASCGDRAGRWPRGKVRPGYRVFCTQACAAAWAAAMVESWHYCRGHRQWYDGNCPACEATIQVDQARCAERSP